LGEKGEMLVAKKCLCPKCKRQRTLRRLPPNFKCADVICDFCGYLAQVKTHTTSTVNELPARLLGAAWKVQKDRMRAGIYFPLFIVQIDERGRNSIFYLSADLQTPGMFLPRKPLSSKARRAGWKGFVYDFKKVSRNSVVEISES
jgi:type II restriction enzyme